MLIFSFQWLTVETSLIPAQVETHIQKFIIGKPRALDGWLRNKTFVHYLGEVANDRFYIKRMSSNSKGYIIPRMFGKISNNGNGSTVRVFIRPHLLFLLGFLAVMALWISFSIAIYRIDGEHKEVWKIPYSAALFYIVVVGSIKFYSYRAAKDFAQAVNGKITRNTY